MQGTRAPEFGFDNPLASALAVLRAILLGPRDFYLNFPADGPVREPVVFVLLVSAVSAALRLALVLIFSTDGAGEAAISVLQGLAFVALSPVIVGAFAGAYLLSVRTFVGPTGTFRELYRMLAYAYGAMIAFWVPVLQAFAFTYATLFLMTLAVRGVYRTSLLTALVTALVGYIPAAILFIYLQVAVTGLAFGSPG